jgi:hypothetical protein
MSDPITFLAEEPRYATAVALSLGSGLYGLRECFAEKQNEIFEMPVFYFYTAEAVERWVAEVFEEEGFKTLEELLVSLDKLRFADILRTLQVCSPGERESYQKALEAISDLEKRREYMRWWKERRRSSLNDIVLTAWKMANSVEKKYLEEQQSQSV